MPKHDLVRRIDQRPHSGTVAYAPSGGFDDEALVRRDGTHDLYSIARWAWQAGAEVAGTLRSWGDGLLQVFGALYVGKSEGPRAGLEEYRGDNGEMSAVLEATDSDNVPIFSAGGLASGDPDDSWVNVGREGYPRIHFDIVPGYNRKLPVVDAALLRGAINLDNINTVVLAKNLPIPVHDYLPTVAYREGQLFQLRTGPDSAILYQWTRWGPEVVAGWHAAALHDHASEAEGGPLLLGTALADVSVSTPAHGELLTYDAGAGQWRNAAGLALSGVQLPVSVQTTDYTLQATDGVVVFDSPTPVAGYLPAATGSGQWYGVRNVGAGALTLYGAAGDYVAAATSYPLTSGQKTHLVDYTQHYWCEL